MKLRVMIVESAAVRGYKFLALCDQNGDPLPGQVRVELSNEVNDVAKVTATFLVGDDVALG